MPAPSPRQGPGRNPPSPQPPDPGTVAAAIMPRLPLVRDLVSRRARGMPFVELWHFELHRGGDGGGRRLRRPAAVGPAGRIGARPPADPVAAGPRQPPPG